MANMIDAGPPPACVIPNCGCQPTTSDFKKISGGFIHKGEPFTICVTKKGKEVDLNTAIYELCEDVEDLKDDSHELPEPFDPSDLQDEIDALIVQNETQNTTISALQTMVQELKDCVDDLKSIN